MIYIMNAKIILEHTPFIKWVANGYRRPDVPFDDLVQAGFVGLMIAAPKFDETRGIKLSTFAVYWIKEEIQKCIRDNTKLIRSPHKMIIVGEEYFDRIHID